MQQRYEGNCEWLTEITLDAKAKPKWPYTKPVSSEVSVHFKDIINVPQYHSDGTQTIINQAIASIKQCMINPFTVELSNKLNIANG